MAKTKQATLEDEGLISTQYDIDEQPSGGVLDPIAWYELTGEDLGLPPGHHDLPPEVEAAIEDQARQIAEEADLEPDEEG